MTSSIRQVFIFDPAPSNLGGIAGTPSNFSATTLTPTLAGSTLVAFACIANQVGNTIASCGHSVNGASSYTDWGTWKQALSTGVGGLDTRVFVKENAPVINAGDNGTSSGGSTTTLVDSSKSWTTNQWVGAVFINHSNGAESTVTSNTAT